MDDFAPARTRRTFEVIGDQIREQVRSGTLKPGDKLPPERTLAEQFGTSRNAVREALRALEHAGLINLQKGAHGGAFITDGDPEAVAQSIEDLLHLGGVELTDITDARLLIARAIVEAVVGLDVVGVVVAHVEVHERRAHLKQSLVVRLQLVVRARQEPRDLAGHARDAVRVEDAERLPVEVGGALGAEDRVQRHGVGGVGGVGELAAGTCVRDAAVL